MKKKPGQFIRRAIRRITVNRKYKDHLFRFIFRNKKDLSFIIDSQLNLYEHQSTWNENMPLRGVFYFSDVLRGYIEDNHLNIYKEKRIPLPMPRYIVFYNGTEQHPDKTELRLSDAYFVQAVRKMQ